MEGEAYSDAIQAYENILAQDPRDSEAKIGLMRARTKWIDHQLIEVRLTRLAGNGGQAIHLLNGILLQEKAWNLFPTGAVAFTQNEETSFSTREFTKLLNESLSGRQPLRTDWLIKADPFVFAQIQMVQRNQLTQNTVSLGAQECARFRKIVQDSPFFSEFVNKFCAHYGIGNLKSKTSPKMAAELIKEIRLESQIANFPHAMEAQLESDLNASFRQTAWFDSDSRRAVKLQASGNFEFIRSSSPQTLYHNYTVEIPYTAYETVYKTREVPYTETQLVYNPLTQQHESQSVSRTRTESYTEQQPVTRTRTEPRVFAFAGERYSEHIKLELSTTVALDAAGEVVLQGAFQKELDQSEDVHAVSMPSMHLSPSPLTLPERDDWISIQSKEFAHKTGTDLAQKWVTSFCDNTPKNLKLSSEPELVFKCLRQPLTSYPVFAQNWFQSHLGLDIPEANQLIGFLRTP